MSIDQFKTHLARYLTQARQARAGEQHHDQRRQLFLDFLKDAFGIGAADVEVEQYIQIAGKQTSAGHIARVKKGWIDAVFPALRVAAIAGACGHIARIYAEWRRRVGAARAREIIREDLLHYVGPQARVA